MGDGSAVMQSVMLLQSGAAGNGVHDALQTLHGSRVSSDGQANHSAGLPPGSDKLSSWGIHNGITQQPPTLPPDPAAGMSSLQRHPSGSQQALQQQAIALAKQQQQLQLQQLQQQQFEFAQSLQQQQQNPAQALVEAHMAQLHGSFTAAASAAAQQHAQQQLLLQQQQQNVLFRRRTTSNDGYNPPPAQQQPVQSPRTQGQFTNQQQQQQQAVSALHQGLLFQQRQQQQQQDLDGLEKPHHQHDQQQQQQQQHMGKPGVLGKQQPGEQGSSSKRAGSHSMHAMATSSIIHQPAPAAAAARTSSNGNAAAAPRVSGTGSAGNSSGSKPGPPSSNLTIRMTLQLVATYTKCKPQGAAAGAVPQPLPRRVLTKPAAAVKNDGSDNESSDLVLCTQDVLVNAAGQRYIVLDMLGSGTFGQVVAAFSEVAGRPMAVKVIKNQPAYYHQARVEVGILQLLNGRCDPGDTHHIVRLHDAFVHRRHLCLAFEQLGINLFELLKRNSFRGLSLGLLRLFLEQILDALIVLRDASIIHCDLKPENILLAPPAPSGGALGQLKLIDFGSACFEGRTVYSYIQSRFYRSPEVLLGLGYTAAIDMWSFGCVAAELFLGLPLFPGASEHDLLSRIMETLGPPPSWMMAAAKRASFFFKKVKAAPTGGAAGGAAGTSSTEASASGSNAAAAGAAGSDGPPNYVLYTKEEFEAVNKCQAPAGKRYFTHSRLADIIGHYPFKAGASDTEAAVERKQREALLDLLLGVLDLDPKTRWTPRQAIKHPFITGETFTGPYQPTADSAPQAIHHHHHHRRHHHHHHQDSQQAGSLSQQQYAVAAAAAAAAAAVGSLGSHAAEQLVGSFGAAAAAAAAGAGGSSGDAAAVGSLHAGASQQQHTRTGPVAMQARSAAHQQQQYAAAAAAAGMLQATPPGSLLGGSFTGGPGSFMPGSTSNMLQYSPAAAQVHARAHAIAMAALQQLSPRLGSSFQAQTAAQLLGTSVSNRGGSGSYTAPTGMNFMQHQQQQQQQLSSSFSPARPLIPSGRSSSSQQQQQHFLRQHHQQQQAQQQGAGAGGETGMVMSPAPQHAGSNPAGSFSGNAGRSSWAGGAGGEYLSSGSLAHSFNHNLLMSPVSPAHMNTVAAALAAARQQHQQHQHAAATSSGLPLPSSTGGASSSRGVNLQQRWRVAMDQQQQQLAGGIASGNTPAGISMQLGEQHGTAHARQQPQQQLQLAESWQQGPAVGLLGQSVSTAGAAGTESFLLQWQHMQQAHNQHQRTAAAAAAGLAAKAAAAATAAVGANAGHGDHGVPLLPPVAAAAVTPSGLVRPSADGDDGVAGSSLDALLQRSNTMDSNGTPVHARNNSMRVSSSDDVMFVMEEAAGSGSLTPTKRDMHADNADCHMMLHGGTSSGGGTTNAHQQQPQPLAGRGPQHQRLQQLAGRPELIASSPLELCPIEEQPGAAAMPHAHHLPVPGAALQQPQALLQPVLQAAQPTAQLQQLQQEDAEQDDLELQEAEVMSEHPGDWDPLYTDEQLLDEQMSPPAVRRQPAAGSDAPHLRGVSHQHSPALLQQPPKQPPVAALFAGSRPVAGAVATVTDSNPALVQQAGNSMMRSRRDSLVHVRAMSVELPGMNDLDSDSVMAMGSAAGAAAGAAGMVGMHEPFEMGGEEEELQVSLDAHWSFRQAARVAGPPQQTRQQQQQASAARSSAGLSVSHPAVGFWDAGTSSSTAAGPTTCFSDMMDATTAGAAGDGAAAAAGAAGAGASGRGMLAGSNMGPTSLGYKGPSSCDTGLGLLRGSQQQSQQPAGGSADDITLLCPDSVGPDGATGGMIFLQP